MKPIPFALAALALASTSARPSDLTIDGYSTRVDSASQTAVFTIDYTVRPRFFQTNHQGLAHDSFALWIDPDAPDAYDRAQQHYFGALANSRQTFVTADAILSTGSLQASQVVDSTTYTGPFGIDGWGPAVGSFAYALSHRVVTFDLPLSLIGATEGSFYYSLQITQYGATEGGPFEGVSGQAYAPPFPIAAVPEPAAGALAAAGLAIMLAWRRALPKRAAAR
jgi:hypothetical protein